MPPRPVTDPGKAVQDSSFSIRPSDQVTRHSFRLFEVCDRPHSHEDEGLVPRIKPAHCRYKVRPISVAGLITSKHITSLDDVSDRLDRT
jgi:hypothetical protein